MIEPIDSTRPPTAALTDSVAAILDDARGAGGLLDLGKLAQTLRGQPEMVGETLSQLPLLDATRLAVDLGLLRGGTLNLVTDLTPGPVGDVADEVLKKTDPAADGLYKTKDEKAQVQMFEAQMADYYWDARAEADLQRVLAPYIKGPQATGPSRYAVEVEAVIDAIKRELGPPPQRT